jgi:NTE family protein
MVDQKDSCEPVFEPFLHENGVESEPGPPESGWALCLSGGGYRAMLFQVGALWRLNELKVLTHLRQISAVSGGSITAATLAANWSQMHRDPAEPDRFDSASFNFALVKPIRQLADQTIDQGAVGRAKILHELPAGDEAAACYGDHLFGNKTLQELPDEPRFVFVATNVKTGSLWRFSKSFMGDHRVGVVRSPSVPLAAAVAAAAAYPPFLSPTKLPLDPAAFDECLSCSYSERAFRQDAILTDGGLSDPLALETAWNRYDTILVSDGGPETSAEPWPVTDPEGHYIGLVELLRRQFCNLRKRQLADALQSNTRGGALWGMAHPIDEYGLKDALHCPVERTQELAHIATRMVRLCEELQERLINFGYAACDAAMRRYYFPSAPPPTGFPYPRTRV